MVNECVKIFPCDGNFEDCFSKHGPFTFVSILVLINGEEDTVERYATINGTMEKWESEFAKQVIEGWVNNGNDRRIRGSGEAVGRNHFNSG